MEHLRLLLAFRLTQASNCIDIGCCVGNVLSEIVRIAPFGRHIAYEPLPAFAAGLRERFPQVDVRESAVADFVGETEFHHVSTRPTVSGLDVRPLPGRTRVEMIRVRVESLDTSIPSDYAPDFIKIDVEGAEARVIRGGLGLISSTRPTIVFEHSRKWAPHSGTGPDEVFELLCDMAGMRIFDLDGTGPYDLTAFRAAFERGRQSNFAALP